MHPILKWLATIVMLAGLGACGGGNAGCSVFDRNCGSGNDDGSSGSGNVATGAVGTVVLSLSSDTVSASTPGTVTALVKNADGTPAANQLVSFAVTNGSATVVPARVKTDASGNASATLTPVAGQVGADLVSASADLGSKPTTLSTRAVFTVTPVSTRLTAIAAAPAVVPAYGASVLTVSVEGASAAAPVTVSFSSTCASAGRAQLSPASVTVTGSSASTTYQDKGCGTADRVSAVINGTSAVQATNLTVVAPVARSLEFVSASPGTICLAGSGCPVAALVGFRVRNQNGDPVAGVNVSFSLDIPGVADLQQSAVPTDEAGLASVSVTARSVPTPVRVRASVTLPDGSTLATVSNVLAINAGLPTTRTISFAAEKSNVDGLETDGNTSTLRVQLNDRYGNAVPDGTAVSFVSEGASVIPARCVTAEGVCTVRLVTSNARPDDGRVTVVAYAQGEEGFDDTDGNNRYTAGETFDDVGRVFVDKNENGVLDTAMGEYLVGVDANAAWDGNTYVRFQRVFTLSSSARAPRLFDAGNAVWDATTAAFAVKPGLATCRVQAVLRLRDGNAAADGLGGNPLPAGAVLSVASKAKGAAVSIDASPVVVNATGPTRHVITVELSDCATALEAEGALDLTVQMPGGTRFTLPLGSVVRAP